MATTKYPRAVKPSEAPAPITASSWISEPALVLLGYALLGLLMLLAPASLLRSVLAAVMGAFGNGYSLSALLFPRRGQLDGIERLAVSGALSLPLGGVAGALLAFSPAGLTLGAFMAVAVVLNLLLLVGVRYRRRNLFPSELPVWPDWGGAASRWWQQNTKESRWVTAALAVLLVIGLGAAYQAALLPSPDPPMTEFYLLDGRGQLDGVPSTAVVGQPLNLDYGIVNRERETHEYEVRATVNGALVGIAQPMRIGPGITRSGQLQLLLTQQELGDREVVFTLLRDRQPDRELRLALSIQPGQ